MKIAKCGFPWEKTTKWPAASFYINCETALGKRSRAFRKSRRPSKRCKRLRELHAPDPLLVSQCELPCCIWDIQCPWRCPSSSNGRRSWLLSPRCYLLFDRLSCRHAASLEPRSGLECIWRDEPAGTANSYVTRSGKSFPPQRVKPRVFP
jgi:hypothetical protein